MYVALRKVLIHQAHCEYLTGMKSCAGFQRCNKERNRGGPCLQAPYNLEKGGHKMNHDESDERKLKKIKIKRRSPQYSGEFGKLSSKF